MRVVSYSSLDRYRDAGCWTAVIKRRHAIERRTPYVRIGSVAVSVWRDATDYGIERVYIGVRCLDIDRAGGRHAAGEEAHAVVAAALFAAGEGDGLGSIA